MMPIITNRFLHIVHLLSATILLLSFSSCILTNPKIYGSYSAVTDFSRDLYSMSGRKETILYKNGRKETITFTPRYRFIKKVTFTSERVKDKTIQGRWKRSKSKIIEVSFSQKNPVEYYKQISKDKIIRLDDNQKELSSRYTSYFTFVRK